MDIYYRNKKKLHDLIKKITKARSDQNKKSNDNMIRAYKHIIKSMENVYDINTG